MCKEYNQRVVELMNQVISSIYKEGITIPGLNKSLAGLGSINNIMVTKEQHAKNVADINASERAVQS